MIVTAGKTNVSVYFYIVQDASATSPGEPVTGLLFSDIETGGSASYARQGAARTDLTLITLANASATHADGGFILVDDTNMPGLYRCDYPDAAFATGVDQVMLQIVVASANNAVASPIFVEITDFDLRDSVRGGMTALPNADADAAGGLPVSDAGGLDLDDIPLNAELNARTLVAASYFDPATDDVATVTTLTNKTGFSLAATGLDAIVSTATGMVEIAKAIWDRVLSGATHNIATSAGRRLRQLEASFVITAGTAQAGTANTITLAAGESATDDIFQGDRVIIVAGTGIEEHGIITVYNGTTKVATMSQNWVITPDATSEYELSPADVDVETWQHVSVTSSSTTNLPEVDAKSISDSTAAADAITEARLAELDAGNLPTDIAAVKTDTAAILVDTADIQPKIGTPAADVSADIAAVKVDTAAILVDTADMQPKLGTPVADVSADIAAVKVDTAEIGVAGAALTDLGGMSAGMKAEVNAEVDTALITTTYAEPAAVPAATASIEEKLSWLAMVARNKITQTATTQIVRDDADGADIGTSAVSDDGVTFIRGEYT